MQSQQSGLPLNCSGDLPVELEQGRPMSGTAVALNRELTAGGASVHRFLLDHGRMPLGVDPGYALLGQATNDAAGLVVHYKVELQQLLGKCMAMSPATCEGLVGFTVESRLSGPAAESVKPLIRNLKCLGREDCNS